MIPLKSPRESMSYVEYAIEAGGSVLSHKRYDSYEDAHFECLVRNAKERERTGRPMIRRRVVFRLVSIGDWNPCVYEITKQQEGKEK